MKTLGIILIIVGVLMCVFSGFSFTSEKKLVDLGPVEINKKENHTLGWPVYAGIGVGLIGVVVLVTGKKSQ